MFAKPPCEPGVVQIIDKMCEIYNKKYITNYFYLLKDKCPCSNCLVKTMCDKQRLECSTYLEFLKHVDEKKPTHIY